MGRDQRLRRAGVVRKTSQAPDPLQYWKERAKYFEGVVVAIVHNHPEKRVVLTDADIRGLELDAQPGEDGSVVLTLVTRDTMQESPATPIGGPCEGGEKGPICHGATGPHVHPPGFSGNPIREPQEGDDE